MRTTEEEKTAKGGEGGTKKKGEEEPQWEHRVCGMQVAQHQPIWVFMSLKSSGVVSLPQFMGIFLHECQDARPFFGLNKSVTYNTGIYSIFLYKKKETI